MKKNNENAPDGRQAKKIKVGIIGGSGLDDPKILENFGEIKLKTPYGATSGPLITGKISDKEVVILPRHGKGHTLPPSAVPFRANIWALKEIGCSHILATTACGSLREKIKPGDFVFIDQFIDFTKQRKMTFHESEVAHTQMAQPFCENLRKNLIAASKELKIKHHAKGAVITIEGPRFSTKAESLMFQNFGADVINMSTVPEAPLAKELGICYASIAMVTDYDCWKEGEEPVSWDMIVETMKHNAEKAKKLLIKVIPKIDFINEV